MPDAQRPHSDRRAEAWSRIDTTKTEDMVPSSELRGWLAEYVGLFEQYEGALATVETLESKEELSAIIRAQTEEIESLSEQMEAAQRDRDDADKLCAHWCDEYDRLKEQLEAARAKQAERPPYRELELLLQASRTSPMLHEAAVTVEEYLRALEEAQQFPVETVMSWKRRANQADAQLAAVRLLLDPERQDDPDEENVLRAFEVAGGRLS